MTTVRSSVNLAGGNLARSCHACAFFRDRAQEYDVLLPFVKAGFDQGERNFHIVDPQHRRERLDRLRAAGIEVDADGRVEVRTWHEAYLRQGHFDPEDMLGLIEEVLQQGRQQGYGMTRLWANMEWAVEDFPGVEELLAYEARLNHVLPRYNDVVVCTYDLNRFDAGTVMDVLRTHPVVVVGGMAHENPFYEPPDRFLEELRQRRG